MTKVSQFMTSDVLTLTPDMPIDKAVSALIDRGVHGAPVVQGGTLVGILTDGDLVIGESRIHVPSMLMIFGEFAMWPPSVRKFERESEKSIATTVGEAMTREVQTVSPHDGIEDVATIMHQRHFTMMPVVDQGRLVGVISREDLLRALSKSE